MMTQLQYAEKVAFVNGIKKHGRAIAFTRQQLAGSMRRARARSKVRANDLSSSISGQRTFMRGLSTKYDLNG